MAERGAPLLEARGIGKQFQGRAVLDGVDLSVRAGEIVTLVGLNGAGKTTLLRIALGLMKPDAGSVRLAPGCRVGYMPQRLPIDPALPLTVARFLTLGRSAPRSALEAALREVHVAHLLGAPFQRISGGEAQRVMLARTLLRAPDLLVLDEPVQGVDIAGRSSLYQMIRRIRDVRGCGVLMVSHDLHLVMAATDRVVCLNHHVCCSGSPEDVSRHPEYLALFGREIAAEIAVYAHAHDHRHDATGEVVPLEAERPAVESPPVERLN
ncbi:MAG TPA: zinc ABC transporter ATP-binding protein ZnuC [Alphaproteobacteria bacterium]|nr:zinc ABC transporter ATP-binding protein ZnuC [Alphaproteobacteria bacterium]